jgi:hypothetical protein
VSLLPHSFPGGAGFATPTGQRDGVGGAFLSHWLVEEGLSEVDDHLRDKELGSVASAQQIWLSPGKTAHIT